MYSQLHATRSCITSEKHQLEQIQWNNSITTTLVWRGFPCYQSSSQAEERCGSFNLNWLTQFRSAVQVNISIFHFQHKWHAWLCQNCIWLSRDLKRHSAAHSWATAITLLQASPFINRTPTITQVNNIQHAKVLAPSFTKIHQTWLGYTYNL